MLYTRQVDAGSSISLKRRLMGGHKASIRSFVSVASSSSNGNGSSTTSSCIFTAGEDSRICEWNLSNVDEIPSGDNNRPVQYVKEWSIHPWGEEVQFGDESIIKKLIHHIDVENNYNCQNK